MEVLLDNYSGIPIYEQICTQIKEAQSHFLCDAGFRS